MNRLTPMSNTHLRTVFLLIGLLLLAACTRNPETVAEVPTLASLPSATPLPTDTATPIPTPTIASTSTRSPTDTPFPTDTPLPTNTLTATNSPVPSNTVHPQSAGSSSQSPAPTPVNTTVPALSVDAQNWIADHEVSPFDDTERFTLLREADTPIRAWLSNPIPTLILRCDSGNFDIFIHVDTQVDVEYGLDDRASARIRFDSDPAQDIVMNESTTGDALFFNNPEQILQSMSTHEVLLFGFTPFNAPFTSTTFHLAGLGEVIEPLMQACRLRNMTFELPPTPSVCSQSELEQALSWATAMQPIVERLPNINSSTDMLALRDEIAAIRYPPCIATARNHLLNALQEMGLASISSTPSIIQMHLDNAMAQLTLLQTETNRILPRSN